MSLRIGHGVGASQFRRQGKKISWTNMLVRSNEFDNVAWTKTNAGAGSVPVVTANDAATPDGTVDAEKIVFAAPGAGDESFINQVITTVAGVVYAGTFYIKAFAAGDIGKIILVRHAGAAGYGTITLTAVYQRIERVETAAGISSTFSIGLRPAVAGSSGTVSAHMCWAQFESGNIPHAYSPTVAAAVTRNAWVR